MEKSEEPNALRLESETSSRQLKMAVTFGGDNGFYKLPQETGATEGQPLRPSEHENKLEKRRRSRRTN